MAENIVPDTDINIPDKILEAMNGISEEETRDGKMLKVPALLRQDKNNRQEYDPIVVSIGPYHHGGKELQSAERVKTQLFMWLVSGSRRGDGQNDAKFFYYKVLDVVNDLRKCYIDVSENQYDDPYFAQMMLLDACFLIGYFDVGPALMEFNGLNELSSAYIRRDLLLLENQIPFWLIKMLIMLLHGEEEGKKKYGALLRRMLINGQSEPIHYLHAVWSEFSSHQSTVPIFNALKNDNNEGVSIYSFSSASELKARGIYFRPSASRKNSFASFKFHQGILFSTLEVPVCHLRKYTKSFFLNMIAYEYSGSGSTFLVHKVTAYIEFMKLLIDDPKDVKELREKEILKVTTLGSDEDVVKVFKELDTYGLDLDQVKELDIVKKNIQAHYNNKVKNWIGELLYTYFRSPLAATALLAAIFLLILTFLQTYYTINPRNG